MRHANHHESVRISLGERSQQYHIYDAEDCSVSSVSKLDRRRIYIIIANDENVADIIYYDVSGILNPDASPLVTGRTFTITGAVVQVDI